MILLIRIKYEIFLLYFEKLGAHYFLNKLEVFLNKLEV